MEPTSLIYLPDGTVLDPVAVAAIFPAQGDVVSYALQGAPGPRSVVTASGEHALEIKAYMVACKELATPARVHLDGDLHLLKAAADRVRAERLTRRLVNSDGTLTSRGSADPAPTRAIELIAAERAKQVQEWGADHDDDHRFGALAVRGAELAIAHTDEELSTHAHESDRWGLVEKHKHDEVRSLTIAGALIAAELDRVLRAQATTTDKAAEPRPDGALRELAAKWLDMGHEYWEAYSRARGRGAVVWTDSTSGALVIYTRGEYRDQLLAAIPEPSDETSVFEHVKITTFETETARVDEALSLTRRAADRLRGAVAVLGTPERTPGNPNIWAAQELMKRAVALCDRVVEGISFWSVDGSGEIPQDHEPDHHR